MKCNEYKSLICTNFCEHYKDRTICKDCYLDPTLRNNFELRKDAETLMQQHVLSNGAVLLKDYSEEVHSEMKKKFGLPAEEEVPNVHLW